jgi:hypothetical protein
MEIEPPGAESPSHRAAQQDDISPVRGLLIGFVLGAALWAALALAILWT